MGDIEDLMARQSPQQRKIGERLRAIIKKTLPGASETTNSFGNPVYSVGGRNVVWLLFGKGHVEMGFFEGISLKSPLLVGKGHKLRRINIASLENIDEKEFTRLLREAQSPP